MTKCYSSQYKELFSQAWTRKRQRLDKKTHTLVNTSSWLPLIVLQQCNTNGTILVNVGVVDLGQELDLQKYQKANLRELEKTLERVSLIHLIDENTSRLYTFGGLNG